jgi:hypothetical protein
LLTSEEFETSASIEKKTVRMDSVYTHALWLLVGGVVPLLITAVTRTLRWWKKRKQKRKSEQAARSHQHELQYDVRVDTEELEEVTEVAAHLESLSLNGSSLREMRDARRGRSENPQITVRVNTSVSVDADESPGWVHVVRSYRNVPEMKLVWVTGTYFVRARQGVLEIVQVSSKPSEEQSVPDKATLQVFRDLLEEMEALKAVEERREQSQGPTCWERLDQDL